MATVQVTGLTALTTAENTDLLPIHDYSASELKKISTSDLLTSLLALLTTNNISWTNVNKSGSSLDDLATKNATDLQATGPDKLLGRISSGTGDVETVTCSSFIRTLLDDADAATARATLGVSLSSDDISNIDQGWYELDASSYTGTSPLYEVYNGSSISSVNAWAAGTSYSLGDFVKKGSPTGVNNFIYECTQAGTSGLSKPAFPDYTNGQDVEITDNTCKWTSRSLHVIELTTPATDFEAGMPIRLNYSGILYLYGIIIYLSSTRMVIKCNSYILTDTFTLSIGSREKVQEICITATGSYAHDLPGTKIVWYGDRIWNKGSSYLVDFKIEHYTDDSGINPILYPYINGYNASGGSRPTTSYARTYESNIAAKSVINYGDLYNINADLTGVNGTCENLIATFVFVCGSGMSIYY